MLLALLGLALFGTTQRANGEGLLPTATPKTMVAVALPTLTKLPASPTATVTQANASGDPERPPTETPRPTRTPRASRTPRPTYTPSPTLVPSPTRTPTPTPRAVPSASEHYWFERPIAAEYENTVATFYPYASTGEGAYQVHHGVEFVNVDGVPVLAAGAGTVVVARSDESTLVGPQDWDPATDGAFYGNVVVIEHDQRYLGQPVFTLYGHMSTITVREGERVETGEQVGEVGSSGIALGPHLHFEVRVGENDYDATRNPQLWLRPFAGQGTIIGKVLDAQGNPVPEAFLSINKPGSEQTYRYEYSYAVESINGDDEWGENFLLGDIPAGRWRIAVEIDGEYVIREVSVRDGQTSWVWLEAKSAGEEK